MNFGGASFHVPSFQYPGMRAIYQQLFCIYRESNPLVISTVNKMWSNPTSSNEPLDYIFIYANPGSKEENVPEHWHFVSLGLSDLYGDNRVHAIDTSASSERTSGLGFELTMRINRVNNELTPPSWPAQLMQQLAKYVFVSRNKFFIGDHIPWNKPIDGSQDSKIQHLLISLDPQLAKIKTILGHVSFMQIVGVTQEEMEQASRWNGKGMLNLLKKDPTTGGISLITDIDRKQSIFDLFPQTIQMLEEDLERDGSDLAGIDAEFFYRELPKIAIKTSLCLSMGSEKSLDFTRHLGRLDIRTSAELNAHLSASSPFMPFSRRPVVLDGVEIIFSPTTAKFLKLAFKDRLKHGRHFTFQNPETHLTFVAESVEGCFVTKEQPIAIQGKWLQIRIEKDFLNIIIEQLKDLEPSRIASMQLPLVFDFPERNMRFVINHLTPTSLMR